jgi:flagellar biosynthesis protein FlhA
VVEEIAASGVSLGTIQHVLRSLVAEDIPLRQLGTILEALIDQVPRELPVTQWTEAVRRRLARTISLRYRAPDGALHHVALDVELDAYLQEHMVWEDNDYAMKISDDNQARLKNLLDAQLEKLRLSGLPPVIVVSPAVRRGFRRWSSLHVPDLVVLSSAELSPDIPHQAVGTVRTADLRPRQTGMSPETRPSEAVSV